jgi:hypothetical protein
MSEAESTVQAFLAAAGLPADPDEVTFLVGQYQIHKAAIESLYAIPAARYEAPALIFDPTPTFADWAE